MKFLKYLVSLVIGVAVSVSLASCGDDDDDEPQSGTKNEQTESSSNYETLIVGNWVNYQRGYGLVFQAGGRGYDYEPSSGSVDELLTWSISNGKLYIVYEYSGEEDPWTIIDLTETTLIVRDEDYEIQTYVRVG